MAHDCSPFASSAHLTVGDLTVRLVWELVPDGVACLAQLLVELEINGEQRLIELFGFAGTDDGRGNGGILQHPGDGNLCKQEMALIATLLEVFYCFQLRLVPVAGLIELPGILNREAGVLLWRLPGMIASCEDTARERIVGNHPDALIGGQGKQFGLDVAEEKIVARLHAIEARDVQCVTRPQCFTEQPGGIVRAADIEYLTTANEIVQSAQRFLKGGVRVGDV